MSGEIVGEEVDRQTRTRRSLDLRPQRMTRDNWLNASAPQWRWQNMADQQRKRKAYEESRVLHRQRYPNRDVKNEPGV